MLTKAGLATVDERDTVCCYARQDKFWVHGTVRRLQHRFPLTANSRSRNIRTETAGMPLMRMPGEIDHPAGDVECVVGQTLVAARYQRQLHRHRDCHLS